MWILIPIAIIITIYVIESINREKYKKFILEHSTAMKKLKRINSNYSFKEIPNFDMVHSYDNQSYFQIISCQDYLTYQLNIIKDKVNDAIHDVDKNKDLFEKYKEEIRETCVMDCYDTLELLRNKNRLIKYETYLFNKQVKAPTTHFSIKVILRLTKINGSYLGHKNKEFSSNEIEDIIHKLNQKSGYFYLNNDIWQSLCRVERGKVTNKMRFAIYERDHYRCCKCGRRTDDLEIDHIIPIAKGGKSTFDNLQTLCHRCNYIKSDNFY